MAAALTGIADIYPLTGSRQDLQALQRFAGGSLSKEYQYLQQLAKRNVVWEHEEFERKTIDSTTRWTLATGGTASAYAVSVTPGDGGWIRGAAGTTAATSGLQLISVPTFKASNNPGFECGFQSSVITEARFEMGFVNAFPSVNTNVGNNLSTPSFNTSTQVAIWLADNASSTTTSGKYTKGTSVTAAKDAFTSGLTLATPIVIRGEVAGGGAYFSVWENGQQMSKPGTTALLTTTTQMVWGLAHVTSDTTDKNIDIDFVTLWHKRGY